MSKLYRKFLFKTCLPDKEQGGNGAGGSRKDLNSYHATEYKLRHVSGCCKIEVKPGTESLDNGYQDETSLKVPCSTRTAEDFSFIQLLIDETLGLSVPTLAHLIPVQISQLALLTDDSASASAHFSILIFS